MQAEKQGINILIVAAKLKLYTFWAYAHTPHDITYVQQNKIEKQLRNNEYRFKSILCKR